MSVFLHVSMLQKQQPVAKIALSAQAVKRFQQGIQ
jgi:hypothetical protein